MLDDQTIRNYEKLYKDKGFDGLLSDNYIGCVPKLTCEQEEQLKDHIRKNNYSAAKEIVEYVKQTFNKIYTPEGMVHTLDRLGFTYKKTTIVPGKANPEKQKKNLSKTTNNSKKRKPLEIRYFFYGWSSSTAQFYVCILLDREKGKKEGNTL